jgi:7,8-dihydropterin-6-yl-methyl-4-(beta-D-ribofuranosyl)aminobenzene 5'-phosphate synthase
MDNTTDLLLTNSRHVVRPPLVRNERIALPPPVAEHGFSTLVTIPGSNEGTSNSFLFDTGVSENGVVHNAGIFGVDFGKIDGIVLSHGHFDHFTGLVNILKRISSSRRTTRNIDVFTHPDAFQKDGQFSQMEKEQDFQFYMNSNFDNWGQRFIKILMLPVSLARNLLC